jgi:hypothetical protein
LKITKRYGFEDMVSFALTSGRGDSSYIHNGMPKEMELLQKGKAWESTELLKGNNAKECRWVCRKEESTKKVVWPRGLVEK